MRLKSAVLSLVLVSTACNNSGQRIPLGKDLSPHSVKDQNRQSNDALAALVKQGGECFPLEKFIEAIENDDTLEMNLYVRNHDVGPHATPTASSGPQIASLDNAKRAPYLMIDSALPILVTSFRGTEMKSQIKSGVVQDLLNVNAEASDQCHTLSFIDPLTNKVSGFTVKSLPPTKTTTTASTPRTSNIQPSTVTIPQPKLILNGITTNETRTYWLDETTTHFYMQREVQVAKDLGQGSTPVFERTVYVLVLGNTTENFKIAKSFASLLAFSLSSPPKDLKNKANSVSEGDTISIVYATYALIQNAVTQKEFKDEVKNPKP